MELRNPHAATTTQVCTGGPAGDGFPQRPTSPLSHIRTMPSDFDAPLTAMLTAAATYKEDGLSENPEAPITAISSDQDSALASTQRHLLSDIALPALRSATAKTEGAVGMHPAAALAAMTAPAEAGGPPAEAMPAPLGAESGSELAGAAVKEIPLGPVEVTVAPSTKRGAAGHRADEGDPQDGEEEGHGIRRVVGLFHPQLYLAGGDCIEVDGGLMSRSGFERLSGTATAKWYVSIKVPPDNITLGAWLRRRGLPVLKGKSRRRKLDTDAKPLGAALWMPRRGPPPPPPSSRPALRAAQNAKRPPSPAPAPSGDDSPAPSAASPLLRSAQSEQPAQPPMSAPTPAPHPFGLHRSACKRPRRQVQGHSGATPAALDAGAAIATAASVPQRAAPEIAATVPGYTSVGADMGAESHAGSPTGQPTGCAGSLLRLPIPVHQLNAGRGCSSSQHRQSNLFPGLRALPPPTQPANGQTPSTEQAAATAAFSPLRQQRDPAILPGLRSGAAADAQALASPSPQWAQLPSCFAAPEDSWSDPLTGDPWAVDGAAGGRAAQHHGSGQGNPDADPLTALLLSAGLFEEDDCEDWCQIDLKACTATLPDGVCGQHSGSSSRQQQQLPPAANGPPLPAAASSGPVHANALLHSCPLPSQPAGDAEWPSSIKGMPDGFAGCVGAEPDGSRGAAAAHHQHEQGRLATTGTHGTCTALQCLRPCTASGPPVRPTVQRAAWAASPGGNCWMGSGGAGNGCADDGYGGGTCTGGGGGGGGGGAGCASDSSNGSGSLVADRLRYPQGIHGHVPDVRHDTFGLAAVSAAPDSMRPSAACDLVIGAPSGQWQGMLPSGHRSPDGRRRNAVGAAAAAPHGGGYQSFGPGPRRHQAWDHLDDAHTRDDSGGGVAGPRRGVSGRGAAAWDRWEAAGGDWGWRGVRRVPPPGPAPAPQPQTVWTLPHAHVHPHARLTRPVQLRNGGRIVRVRPLSAGAVAGETEFGSWGAPGQDVPLMAAAGARPTGHIDSAAMAGRWSPAPGQVPWCSGGPKERFGRYAALPHRGPGEPPPYFG